jgi:hypothetical protein
MHIVISGALLKFVNYQREHELEAATPLTGIKELTTKFPDLKNALFDESGELRKFNVVYIDKKKASPNSLNLEAQSDTKVEIITAIAGG